MRRASLLVVPLFIHFFGCTRTVDPPEGLTFVDRKTTPAPTATLVAKDSDDGFGSAVAVYDGDVWVGAPHGTEGRVYRWSSDDITPALAGPGRLGAHLQATATSLLVSAPLDDRVLDQDGNTVHSGLSGMGIALSAGGDVAWESGWRGPDGNDRETPGRPSTLHRDGDRVGVGMIHGPVAFVDGEQQLARPEAGDEAGFSLASGTVDGEEVWILGAPAANRVIAVRKADLGIQREWTGTGRFGHTIVTVDVDGDDRVDLVVGAPLDGDQGRVVWFPDMTTAPEGIELNAPDARGAGMAMTSDETRLIIGAPGSPTALGQVIMLPLPL